jgi:hypothetical protein
VDPLDERYPRKEDGGTYSTERTETDFEQSFDVIGDDFRFRLSKHSESDDRTSPLESWNLFRSTYNTVISAWG